MCVFYKKALSINTCKCFGSLDIQITLFKRRPNVDDPTFEMDCEACVEERPLLK